MMRPRIIHFFLALLLSAALTAPVVQAAAFDELSNGLQKTGTEGGFNVLTNGAPKQQFVRAWTGYLNGMLLVIGLLFMILVIYGGWIWMSAQGNDERVVKGKNLIIQAVIGLAIIIGARIIVELVIITLGETIK